MKPSSYTIIEYPAGRSPGVENDNSLQYSWLENYMDRGTWWAAVHGVLKSDTTECVHMHTHTHISQKETKTDNLPKSIELSI